MNQYLKSAVKRYKPDKENAVIHPISEIDADIIVEIIEVLRKNKIDDVKEILSSYKYLKDEEIRDSLIQWNINNPDTPEEDQLKEEKEKEEPERMLKLGEYLIGESKFHAIKFDPVRFRAIINPSTTEVTKSPYSNMVIRFADLEELQIFTEKIKEYTGREIIILY